MRAHERIAHVALMAAREREYTALVVCDQAREHLTEANEDHRATWQLLYGNACDRARAATNARYDAEEGAYEAMFLGGKA